MKRRLLHPLDRYVLTEFTKIFIATALGFPLLAIVIDLTDSLSKYLGRNLTPGEIALSYVYWIPDSMFMVLPAAVLFATVFAIGAFTRNSEVMAAKASGISFHRLVAPIFLGAFVITIFGLGLGELVPITNARRNAILKTDQAPTEGANRFNFPYAAGGGRVYKVASLNVSQQRIQNVEIERRGKGPRYPTYLVSAQTAVFDSTRHDWMLHDGELHVLSDAGAGLAVSFDSLRDRRFTQAPMELTTASRSPDEMRFGELYRFIQALARSGGEVNELKVELALKIAVPVTCLIIAIFGAPLATSSQRGGAAYGIGVSLATTIVFLMFIQITKAIGGGGVIPPYLAAWIPNALFGTVGVILLARTRT
ncbi:MAG TPA: LptF/LptG family permease [Gemmatimonadaceae bacterium]|nr:LptF/LptG family permease [Gemmatimonadaceae bacterium]